MPNDDAGRYADVERMLRTKLRNFYAGITPVNYLLLHTLHLIAHHYSKFPRWMRRCCHQLVQGQLIQHEAILCLLDSKHRIAGLMEVIHCIDRAIHITPIYG